MRRALIFKQGSLVQARDQLVRPFWLLTIFLLPLWAGNNRKSQSPLVMGGFGVTGQSPLSITSKEPDRLIIDKGITLPPTHRVVTKWIQDRDINTPT